MTAYTRRLYLSGPIANCSDAEITIWRGRVEQCARKVAAEMRGDGVEIELEVISPRPACESDTRESIVEQDKADIRSSHLVVAFPWTDSIGTAMEVMYASQIGVPVLLIVDSRWDVSPWYETHAAAVASGAIDDTAENASEVMEFGMLWLNDAFDGVVSDSLSIMFSMLDNGAPASLTQA